MVGQYPGFRLSYSNPEDALRWQIYGVALRDVEPVAYQGTSAFSGVKIC